MVDLTQHARKPTDWGDPYAHKIPLIPFIADEDVKWLIIHWGGGPNIAGEPIEEPGLTFRQKVGLQIGRVSRVIQGWSRYHVESKGFRGIAYSYAVDPLFGRLFELRGQRENGGQSGTAPSVDGGWFHVNGHSVAVAIVHGASQVATKRCWKTIGRMWIELGGPDVRGHRYFNPWVADPGHRTSCPGDKNMLRIERTLYVRALGTLRYRNRLFRSRGGATETLNRRLKDLGYPAVRGRVYGTLEKALVMLFQAAEGLSVDGVVGPQTWTALARARRT